MRKLDVAGSSNAEALAMEKKYIQRAELSATELIIVDEFMDFGIIDVSNWLI